MFVRLQRARLLGNKRHRRPGLRWYCISKVHCMPCFERRCPGFVGSLSCNPLMLLSRRVRPATSSLRRIEATFDTKHSSWRQPTIHFSSPNLMPVCCAVCDAGAWCPGSPQEVQSLFRPDRSAACFTTNLRYPVALSSRHSSDNATSIPAKSKCLV
jgi:hypothetical protein